MKVKGKMVRESRFAVAVRKMTTALRLPSTRGACGATRSGSLRVAS